MKIESSVISEVGTNNLFPVFLKLEELTVLLVGGGNVGLEKLSAIISNAPLTQVTVVAIEINEGIRSLAATHGNIRLEQREYSAEDIDSAAIIITAIDDPFTSEQIRNDAKSKGKLLNAADKPALCDFYLGSIVKKGNLKIAISTNGKSPTIAKRLKEVLNDVIPGELDEVLQNMQVIRNQLSGNFTDKVNKLNSITKDLALKNNIDSKKGERTWKRIATYSLAAFFFMILGHVLLSYVPFSAITSSIKSIPGQIEPIFYWMIAAGFAAQLVDGALGMGYGVTCTTILLSLGVNLPVISGSIHTAEMFSSGMSGYSHYKFGNVNKKLFKALLIPGIIGAVIGAYMLSKFGTKYADYIRPVLAAYTLFLGAKIIYGAFRKSKPQKVKRVGWLAGAGGFLDSFGGGGWGPLVTSTLISKGRTPKYVIGSVSISEFFVTLASALTFFSMLGISHWQIIVGMVLGGMAAAPIAARLAGRLPLKTMFISVGSLVIFWSLRILLKSLGVF
ncbi:MAG: TSUP family transporter [Chitinophagaceae bacterium]|nr:TSUP family transporter [Chitinophagaceae bacterium]